MCKILNKGHRIRASDKHLVYHFSIGTLLFLFVAVLLLLNIKRLRDLENGQCLLQDLYGRVGVVQIHPVFEEFTKGAERT